jgi:hypothetical protein
LEDVRRVIAYAEHTKNMLVSTTTRHYLAYHRPSKVTFWLEYTLEGDSYRIYHAYSHRFDCRLQSRRHLTTFLLKLSTQVHLLAIKSCSSHSLPPSRIPWRT